MAISLIQYQACRLLFELRGKRTSLLAHQTPLHGEHSRLNWCLGTLSHYIHHFERDDATLAEGCDSGREPLRQA